MNLFICNGVILIQKMKYTILFLVSYRFCLLSTTKIGKILDMFRSRSDIRMLTCIWGWCRQHLD